MAAQGELTEQTLDKFALLLARLERYSHLRGAILLEDVTAQLAEDFVTAPGRSRYGHAGEATLATQILRRSVIRSAWRTLRELTLTDQDPARDIHLPAHTHAAVRALTEIEAADLRHQTSFTDRPTRHAAVAALALAGGHSGEIGHVRIKDLDPDGRRVWMHGSTKTDPRWCPLDDWALQVLTTRAQFVAARQLRPATAPGARLAVSDRHADDAALQARACVALADLLRRIGLGGEADVKPSSISARAAVEAFEATRHIEDAARRLGLRSLDRAAAVIGLAWHPGHADSPDAANGRQPVEHCDA
ncbi:hypothetical protein ACIQBJ_25290 [Kitasatospora sp. NPDC088391]|uniref:hypothetical protein n=1 Tax=Kitasatospora sp. NPDC088391 TaxID=3364074 RepID=UPI00382DCD02